jgi:hypothetical protein
MSNHDRHGPDSAIRRNARKTLSQGAYYHESFLRSKRFLCRRIKRTLNKTSGPNARSGEDEQAPNFYTMPNLPEELGATAAQLPDNEDLVIRPPPAHGRSKTRRVGFTTNVDESVHEGLASPAALVSSSLRSDASSRATSSATPQLTQSRSLPSLYQRAAPSGQSFGAAAAAAANVGEYARLPAEMSSLNPRWLLDRRALLCQHAATAAAALLRSHEQTLALHQLVSGLSTFHSDPLNALQAPAAHPNLTRLLRSRNDYQHPFTPQLSRTLPLPPLQDFLRQQQLLRHLQSQQQPQRQQQHRERGTEEGKSADLEVFMEAYMRRYNETETKHSY